MTHSCLSREISHETYLTEVLVGKKSKEAANKIFAGHDLLAFNIFRGIFVENLAEFVGRSALEVWWTLKKERKNSINFNSTIGKFSTSSSSDVVLIIIVRVNMWITSQSDYYWEAAVLTKEATPMKRQL